VPESDENKCKSCKQPNWVDKLTLVVLAATWVTVAIYTHVSSKILDADTRPYVGIAIYGTTEIPIFTPSQDRSLTIPLAFLDYGKLPGDSMIKGTVFPSADRLDQGPPLDSIIPLHKMLWPPPVQNYENITMQTPLTDDQVKWMNDGVYKWLYLRVEAVYQGHVTEFCMEWPITIGTTGSGTTQRPVPVLLSHSLCQSRASNYAN
jgi:hypothetical protein